MFKKIVFLSIGLLLTAACGTKTGNGYTGGATGDGAVTIKSQAFSPSLSAFLLRAFELTPQASVSTFKFCVKKVKLKNESGSEVTKNGSGEIEMKLGLIDVSSGAEKSWGTPSIPSGFSLSRIEVIVEKDKELCGIEDAVQYNSYSVQDNVEFKWNVSPAVTINSGDVISLSLASVVSALNQAATAGQLNDENLRTYIQNATGTAEKD